MERVYFEKRLPHISESQYSVDEVDDYNEAGVEGGEQHKFILKENLTMTTMMMIVTVDKSGLICFCFPL